MLLFDRLEFPRNVVRIILSFQDQLVTVKIVIEFGDHIDIFFFKVEERNISDQNASPSPYIPCDLIDIVRDIQYIIRKYDLIVVVLELHLLKLGIVKERQQVFHPVQDLIYVVE